MYRVYDYVKLCNVSCHDYVKFCNISQFYAVLIYVDGWIDLSIVIYLSKEY